MKPFKILLPLFLLVPLLLPAGQATAAGALQAAPPVLASQNQDEPAGMTPADRSPLDELDPRQATWQAWIGPILLGVFAIILLLAIRRFSMGGKQKPTTGPDAEDRHKPEKRSDGNC